MVLCLIGGWVGMVDDNLKILFSRALTLDSIWIALESRLFEILLFLCVLFFGRYALGQLPEVWAAIRLFPVYSKAWRSKILLLGGSAVVVLGMFAWFSINYFRHAGLLRRKYDKLLVTRALDRVQQGDSEGGRHLLEVGVRIFNSQTCRDQLKKLEEREELKKAALAVCRQLPFGVHDELSLWNVFQEQFPELKGDLETELRNRQEKIKSFTTTLQSVVQLVHARQISQASKALRPVQEVAPYFWNCGRLMIELESLKSHGNREPTPLVDSITGSDPDWFLGKLSDVGEIESPTVHPRSRKPAPSAFRFASLDSNFVLFEATSEERISEVSEKLAINEDVLSKLNEDRLAPGALDTLQSNPWVRVSTTEQLFGRLQHSSRSSVELEPQAPPPTQEDELTATAQKLFSESPAPKEVSLGTDLPPKVAAPKSVLHRVRNGETPDSIAKIYSVSLNSVLQKNGLSPKTRLSEGQTLTIMLPENHPLLKAGPRKAQAPSSEAESDSLDVKSEVDDSKRGPANEVNWMEYVVRSGDSLRSIADMMGTSAEDIIQLNDLGDNGELYVGRRLRVKKQSSELFVRPVGTRPVVATSKENPVKDSIPSAQKTSTPGRVKSPYPPYHLLNVTGQESGQLAMDPKTQKIFRIP